MDFIFNPSLVLYLPLYQLDGASFASRDKHGHLATVTGATWRLDGRILDGIDDFISVPSSDALNPSSITLLAWAYPTTGAAIQYAIISKNNPSLKTGYVLAWKGGAADYRFGFGWGDGAVWQWKTTLAQYTTLNQWYHIGATYDGTTWAIYINGVLENSGTQAGSIVSNTVNLNIGRDVSGSTWYWAGTIGAAWIYNRALTANEVQRHYLPTKWRYQ